MSNFYINPFTAKYKYFNLDRNEKHFRMYALDEDLNEFYMGEHRSVDSAEQFLTNLFGKPLEKL